MSEKQKVVMVPYDIGEDQSVRKDADGSWVYGDDEVEVEAGDDEAD